MDVNVVDFLSRQGGPTTYESWCMTALGCSSQNKTLTRATSAFNGKPKRTQRHVVMTQTEWLREYEREKEKDIT